MGDVEIVIKVPENLDPNNIVAKAKVLAKWEQLVRAAEEKKKRIRNATRVKLTGDSSEFENFVEEGYLLDIR